MRKIYQKQLPLMPNNIDHPRAKEFERISQILDSIPTILDLVLQDLTHGVENSDCGAEGMTAEQVLRAAIINSPKASVIQNLLFI